MTAGERTSEWFDPYLSSQLFLPQDLNFTDITINRHVKIQNYIHPSLNHHDIWIVEGSNPDTSKQSTKNYSSIIQTLQNKLKNATEPVEVKKIQTVIKCNQTKLKKQQDNAGKILKCFTIGIPFNQEQHQIVSGWYSECITVYNKCVELSATTSTSLSDNQLREQVFNQLYGDNDKPAPYDSLHDEIRSFISNKKSCFTSLRRKVITHFTQQPRKAKDNLSIMIPGTAITKLGVFGTRLGSIRGWNHIYAKIQKVCGEGKLCDSRLVYDSVLKRYTLNIPYYASRQLTAGKKLIVALDPGEKIFMTYYSPQQSGYIGNNIRLQILEEEKKIRRLERIIKHKKNKKKEKLKNPKAIKRRIQVKYNRIRNIVSELHHQTAKYLTDHYSRIYIPSFETQKMISNGRPKNKGNTLVSKKENKRKSRLNRRVKFVLNSLSHYRFRQHLQNKCLEKGCKMEVVDESYTSMTCGSCGKQSKTYSNRMKECSCGCKVDRDINGARNIYIKTISTY